MAFQVCGFLEDPKRDAGVEVLQCSFLYKFGSNCGAVPLFSFLMLSSILLRSLATLVVGFNLLSVNFKYVLVSFNKTATFSLYSSLSSQLWIFLCGLEGYLQSHPFSGFATLSPVLL